MIIAVTDKNICKENFIDRIRKLVKASPDAILLRAKELEERRYQELAEHCRSICRQAEIPLILHGFSCVAERMDEKRIHLSYGEACEYLCKANGIDTVGVSVHSLEEATVAEKLGAAYLIAGHIFPTACKPGCPPRGLAFLEEICAAVSVPVYAIGGITPENAAMVMEHGAKGICLMSPVMCCEDPVIELAQYRQRIRRDRESKSMV